MHYNAGTINRLKSAYIKCTKIFFGFSRRHSVTQMLQELHIVCFDTILFNSRLKFKSLWNSSHNRLVNWLCQLVYFCILLCSLFIRLFCMSVCLLCLSFFRVCVLYGPCCLI